MAIKIEPDEMEVIKTIAKRHGYGYADVCGKVRNKNIVEVRAIIVAILRDKYKLSFPKIGFFLCRDHSTIMSLYSQKNKYEAQINKFSKSAPHMQNVDNARWHKLWQMVEAKCMICGIEDIVEIHHIIPKKSGGSNALDNLLVLCPNHHAMLHYGMLKINDMPSIINKAKK